MGWRRSGGAEAAAMAAALLSASPALAQSPIVGPRLDQIRPSLHRTQRRARARPQRPAYAPTQFKPFLLRGVVVEGSTASAALLATAWRPYVGRTATLADINALVDAVADAYGRSDVALYAVSVPDQTLTDGVLHLRAVESAVSAVDVVAGRGVRVTRRVRRLAQPLLAERPLKRSSLAALLAQVREIPGVTVEAKVTALGPGLVTLQLTLAQARVGLTASADNQGQSGLGRWEGTATLSLNSLFRPGDQTQITTLDSLGLGRLRYFAVSEAQPVGDATLGASFGYLDTHVPGANGRAYQAGVSFSTPVWRRGDTLVTGSVALDGVNVDNAFIAEGSERDHTRAIRLSMGYSGGGGDDSRALALSLSRGIDGLGAQVASRGISDPAFTKLAYTAGWDHGFGDNWVVRVRSQGQVGFGLLPLVEQFALGGSTAGRAFLGVTAVGDSGVYSSAELARRFSTIGPLRPAEVYGFVDGGYARYRGRLGYVGVDQSLSSIGLGGRSQIAPHVVLQLEGAHALTQNLPVHAADDRVNLVLKLTL